VTGIHFKWTNAILLVAAGIAVGTFVGASITARSLVGVPPLVAYLTSEQLETQSYLRFRFASDDVAQRSLQSYVDALDRHADDLRSIQYYEFARRRGLAFARLGILAERSGNAAKRDRLFDKARLSYATANVQASAVDLREIVRNADEQWDKTVRTVAVLEGETTAANRN
jgi:hypothetical protein